MVKFNGGVTRWFQANGEAGWSRDYMTNHNDFSQATILSLYGAICLCYGESIVATTRSFEHVTGKGVYDWDNFQEMMEAIERIGL